LSAEQNKQVAKDGYEAFGRGDVEGALENISDSVEWVVKGDSAISGTYRGKEQVAGQLWAKLAEQGFQTNPSEFIAEGDKVVVLATWSAGGEEARVVDVITYDGQGQLAHFESFGGENMLERVFTK
jgi:uncharacterized protein